MNSTALYLLLDSEFQWVAFDENYETVSKLLHEVGTATIMSASDEGLTVDDTDKIRAQYVRESLS